LDQFQISGKQELVLQFGGRASGDNAEASQFGITFSTAALGDIGGNCGCGAANRKGQAVSLLAWKRSGDGVERQSELVSLSQTFKFRKSFMDGLCLKFSR